MLIKSFYFWLNHPVDKVKFGNEKKRYVMPKNEIKFTILELHCKETAGHLGTNKIIESLWERLHVHTLRTSTYHPQTDGITERFNRTIKTMKAQFVEQNKQNDWDIKLNNLTSAFNTVVHAQKLSPFKRMFGWVPKLRFGLR